MSSKSYVAVLLHFVDLVTLKNVNITLGLVEKSNQDADGLVS